MSSKKGRILETAMELSREHGYTSITKNQIGKICFVAPTLIDYYYGDMGEFRDLIVAQAIEDSDAVIVAQAIVNKHPLTENITSELRQAAAGTLL